MIIKTVGAAGVCLVTYELFKVMPNIALFCLGLLLAFGALFVHVERKASREARD
jgi:hypothetical protein